jgi:predicted DNA-binding protein YlxM (UPF0122 family)
MFSEKCDNYRDGRVKLQQKIKKRDDKIQALEERLGHYERVMMQRDIDGRMENDMQNINSHRRM